MIEIISQEEYMETILGTFGEKFRTTEGTLVTRIGELFYAHHYKGIQFLMSYYAIHDSRESVKVLDDAVIEHGIEPQIFIRRMKLELL
jgi:hypothetical protein